MLPFVICVFNKYSMQNVTVVWRACDARFGVHAKDRFFSNSKTEVSITCFQSFYNSFKNYLDRTKFVIILDRPSQKLLNFYKTIDAKIVNYIGDSKGGLRQNIQTSLQEAYNVTTDWVWIQEDDYLFVENAAESFFNLIDNKNRILKQKNDKINLIIYPADYSDRYIRTQDGRSRYQLFLGDYGYWREIHNTTFSWCIKTANLNLLKDQFQQMFVERRYKNFDSYLSEEIWKDSLIVSPLPSLSFHLDSHVKPPPCIDWKGLWNKNVHVCV